MLEKCSRSSLRKFGLDVGQMLKKLAFKGLKKFHKNECGLEGGWVKLKEI